MHEGVMGGHRGIEVTYQKLKYLFYWNEQDNKIKGFGIRGRETVNEGHQRWKKAFPMKREVLIYNRIAQLAKLPEQLEIARDNMIKSHLRKKKWFDDKKNIRINPFVTGDLVLLFDSTFEIISIGRKFKRRYKGPYIVIEAYLNGIYKN
ncbi:hypothetical protein ROZALSC1DRAFT_23288 [Rozella allomycis CSF55]|uniref:Integrase zinc-binding domain-containing protein n=1 Tax=Rozella allomycis (strain CSF55) TaxID=988480 RepID=A0A4P9YI35_ROZAC|nr:hypothetical protein ROZALSC1DRAFT_23288 [Rozella allomycis CSF55]